ncbi:MAG: formylglycine-generating enzyme family protein [Planctomycetota bacterium]|nr:formylglycine-generating enzyme family protein [Planctomycetota bacterium]
MRDLLLPLAVGLAILAGSVFWHPPRSVPRPVPVNYTQAIAGTPLSFELVWVPGADAWLGKHEVTWAEYEAYYFSKDLEDGTQAIARPSPAYLPHDRGWGTGRMPAIGISQHAAMHYCTWLSLKTGVTYHLPTDAQWQAALGPSVAIDDEAWHAENSGGRTHPVGEKAANALGLHDMRGNAWEYCQGTLGDEEPLPLMRGGCWNSSPADVKGDLRAPCPSEAWNDSDPQRPRGIWWLSTGPFVGFRVARTRD